MRKLALGLALLAAPLCAENYVTVGVGPYVLLPNVGYGYIEQVDNGKLDLQGNLTLSKMATVAEIKGAWRLPVGEYYIAPAIHFGFEKSPYFKLRTYSGVGVNFGKEIEGGFMQLCIQDDVSSKGFSEMPNVKLQYGVYF